MGSAYSTDGLTLWVHGEEFSYRLGIRDLVLERLSLCGQYLEYKDNVGGGVIYVCRDWHEWREG